ncbi:uncharacterized protein LOC123192322 [Mangifera indica]|uniref:uncharacterized protein LOC123192322 n=1 Tax=Mangifera indica TaxID=29780 RepID=UPI001CFC2B92|nr:uncharacterized protein LOC123192322 [Mangifera indica]
MLVGQTSDSNHPISISKLSNTIIGIGLRFGEDDWQCVRARVYVKKKRGGKKAELKKQAEELADSNGEDITGKAIILTECYNSKTGGNNIVDDFGEQSGGTPDGSNSGAAKATDRQQKYGDLLEKNGTLKILEAELAHEDWCSHSEETNDKGWARKGMGDTEEKKKE